jgi:hypothetical protein
VSGRGGLGCARNLAIQICNTRYLAFLNADCYPEPSWLAQLRRSLDSHGAAVAGGRQLELRDGTAAERWKRLHLRQDRGEFRILDPDFLSGGNLLLDLDRVGQTWFGEEFRAAYEDVDFCRRLRSAGGRLLYEPAAVVSHDHMEDWCSLARKVWSYGAQSPTVGPVRGPFGAFRAYARMHGRPHDHARRALIADFASRRLGYVVADVWLLLASLILFVGKATVMEDDG